MDPRTSSGTVRPVSTALALISTACATAAALAVFLLSRPDLYLRAADHVNWRFGWPSPAQARLESILERVHLRADALVEPGATLLFGDSHLHALPASALPVRVVNYAISGETAAALSERIGRYGSVAQSGRIVVLTGQNDLARGADDASVTGAVDTILRRVPATTGVVLIALLPASEPDVAVARRTRLNARLEQICSARPGCRFMPSGALADAEGRLDARYAERDGIHLTAVGYQTLSVALKPAFDQVGAQR